MSNIENIEYYAVCPACGAANGSRSVCEYCGASLIKSRSIDPEAMIAQEDINIPIARGSLVSDDKFMLIFCLIFGGAFLLVPTGIFTVFMSVGMFEPFLLGMFSIFWVIGIGSFVPLIVSSVKKHKCKNGEMVIGEVRGYEKGSVVVNGSPVLCMKIKIYENGSPRIMILSTGSSEKTYPVGSKVQFRRYKNDFMIG